MDCRAESFPNSQQSERINRAAQSRVVGVMIVVNWDPSQDGLLGRCDALLREWNISSASPHYQQDSSLTSQTESFTIVWDWREGDWAISHNILHILCQRNHDSVNFFYVFISKNVKIRRQQRKSWQLLWSVVKQNEQLSVVIPRQTSPAQQKHKLCPKSGWSF